VDAYFTEGLFTTGIKAYNYLANTSSLGLTLLNKDEAAKLSVFADLNPGTNEIASVWFNKQDDPAIYKATAKVTLSYNVNTRVATYAIDGIAGQGVVEVSKEQMPNELLLPVGIETPCEVTFRYEKGVWKVLSVDDIASPYKWVNYDASNAMAAEYANTGKLEVYGLDSTLTSYKVKSNLQGFWVREGAFEVRVDPSFGTKPGYVAPKFYKTWDEVSALFGAADLEDEDYLSYNPDGQSAEPSYDYESFSVLTDGKAALVIVYVDANGHIHSDITDGATVFPYNDKVAQG
ncbi:MAG: hypothetical protein PUD44_06825, partial [Clostridiaceae bacterium]|nr:hypothetical protein [Clostridiaceae bacterium]